MVTMPNQTGQKTKFRKKKGAKQKRHVFTFESRLQGFAQIKSLIAGTGCCKWPAFPAFFNPTTPFQNTARAQSPPPCLSFQHTLFYADFQGRN